MTSLRGVNATSPTVRHEAPGEDEGRSQPATSFNAGAADRADTRSASCAPQAPLCGITRNTGSIEWVCVRPVHDTGGKNRGQQVTGYYPESERHYFRPKYPERKP
jgi:hypothetical protein